MVVVVPSSLHGSKGGVYMHVKVGSAVRPPPPLDLHAWCVYLRESVSLERTFVDKHARKQDTMTLINPLCL